MKKPSLRRHILLLIVALAGAGGVLHGCFISSWGGGQSEQALQTQDQRASDLEREFAEMERRTAVKNEVTARLLLGELTLFEAGAWFLALAEETPDSKTVKLGELGHSDEEKACHQVIARLEENLKLQGRDREAEEASCRLEHELWEHVQNNGRVVLPDRLPNRFPPPAHPQGSPAGH